MNLHIVSALVCLSLHLAASLSKWEVINEVEPFDDSGTQEELLTREELIPYRPKGSRPRSRLRPPAPAPPKRALPPAADKNKNPWGIQPAGQVPRPRAGRDRVPSQEKSEVEEEELLPIGYPRRRSQRHLLETASFLGPSLPPEAELKRLLGRAGLANLSAGCKDKTDEECLHEINEFLGRQQQAGGQTQEDDDDVADPRDRNPERSRQEGRELLLSRAKRQSGTGTGDNFDEDDNIEGSGTGEDHLYQNQTVHTNEGQFELTFPVSVKPQDGVSVLDDEKLERYRKELEEQLTKKLKKTLPGFVSVTVDTPKIVNDKLVATPKILVDGGEAAIEVGEENLEEGLIRTLRNATIPSLEDIQIFGDNLTLPVDPTRLVDELTTILGDYCGSVDPCPSPEYDSSKCANTAFMRGVCPHKCTDYRCRNRAPCMLNSAFDPYCNCGEQYTGKFCQRRKSKRKVLTPGEKVGVGVASVAAVVSVLGCCGLLLCWRKKSGEMLYTYYSDEGALEEQSNATNLGPMVIPRPIIGEQPFNIFNHQEGFES